MLFCSKNFRQNLKLYNNQIPQETDYVIPFNVKKDICSDLFYSWLKDLWFAPYDLQSSLVLNEFKALLVPFWEFEVETFSKYNATLGMGSKLLTGTTSRWEIGVHYFKHSHVMVCAAGSREASLLAQMEVWKVDQIQPFTLQHAEGVEVQPFSLDADRAWATIGKPKIEALIEDACRKQIHQKVSQISIDTSFSNRKARRIFVPIYITTYEYRGKSYYFILNGSTAKVFGQRPYSAG